MQEVNSENARAADCMIKAADCIIFLNTWKQEIVRPQALWYR